MLGDDLDRIIALGEHRLDERCELALEVEDDRGRAGQLDTADFFVSDV